MSGLSSRFIMYKEQEDEALNRPTVYEANTTHDFIEDMLGNPGFMELMSHDMKAAMLVARDTLCWSLGHDSNENLAINLGVWADAYNKFMGLEPGYDN